MGIYESGLLNSLYANDAVITPQLEHLHAKENLLGGTSVSDGAGNTLFETMPSAAGGETVMFGNGETGHLTDNIYGGTTLDMPGIEDDIVGRPSIFGEEHFYQSGEHIGSAGPDFMGEGTVFTGSAGDTLFTSSPDLFGGTQISFSSPLIDHSSSWQNFDLTSRFSEIDTVSSQVSMADFGSAADAADTLDFLDFF